MKRNRLIRAWTNAATRAFVDQVNGKPSPLGWVVKWLWVQPLSYGIGFFTSDDGKET